MAREGAPHRNPGIPAPRVEPPIRWLSAELRGLFGGRVVKVPLDGGFSCPNRDGALGTGGCSWCDPGGSGPDGPVRAIPWEEALRRGAAHAAARRFAGILAYFQAFTPTHARASDLASCLERALAVPGVLGLVVGSRPDCLERETVEVLEEFGRRTFLWVEVGMQTRHDATLVAMNRGHGQAATVSAVETLRQGNIRIVLHLILGLPGETPVMIRESLAEAARLRPWGVKFHPLHVVRGSALEGTWRRGAIDLLGLEEYAALVADGLERVHPATVVHRLTGERPGDLLLAPDWCRDKTSVLTAIRREFERRGSRQGALWR